eukprot:14855700-Alexandrium_andersonii.AAC.1
MEDRVDELPARSVEEPDGEVPTRVGRPLIPDRLLQDAGGHACERQEELASPPVVRHVDPTLAVQ